MRLVAILKPTWKYLGEDVDIKTPKNKFWQTACATEAKSCVCIRKLHVYSV